MQSVLIINSEIYDKYLRYAYFFNWFEDNSDIAVCIWNKFTSDKADIDELVPQLFETVKNVSEWKAYIVDEPFDSREYIEKDFDLKTQCSVNPYERAHHEKDYDPSADALMQLLYYLGGRGVEELEYIGNYTFRAARPTQICVLTPRIFEKLDMQKYFLKSEIEEYTREQMGDADALLIESGTVSLEYSEFWDRYEYPPNCRFLVFDLPEASSVRYNDSWFLLWSATMTLILNSFSSAELGPYKLYRLGIDISADELAAFLNRYHVALCSACEITDKEIENEVTAIKLAMEDTTCNHPVECAPVYVNFPDTDFGKFFPNSNSFGLTKDKPRLDTSVWEQHMLDYQTETHHLFKAIVRGKSEAVDAMNRTLDIDLPLLKNQRLTRYDIEDIIEDLNKSEIEMLGLKTEKTASRALFEKQEREAGRHVENALPGRVTLGTFKGITAIGVAICMMGFIPFIISSAKFNATSFLMSLLITVFTGAAVAAASYAALKIQRRRFDAKLDHYSGVVATNLAVVKENSLIQSKYLTHLLNYMEKYQMLISGKIDERHLKRLEELTKIRTAYEDAIEQCSLAAGLCSISLSREDPDNSAEQVVLSAGKKIYLHDDIDSLFIPLNVAPNRLLPPFTFVKTLHICEEVIYESGLYFRYPENEENADGAKGEEI